MQAFVVSFLAQALMFVSALTGMHTPAPAANHVQSGSVELGLHETSPRGNAGGFAMPASGCSDLSHGPIHDCAITPDISVNHPIIRLGDPVTVSWDPRGNTGCVLSTNLSSKSPAPNANAAGSTPDTPTGETTYSIICNGAGNQDSVTVKVLPRIQET